MYVTPTSDVFGPCTTLEDFEFGVGEGLEVS